jgi:copper(I)-binding protein
MESEEQPVSRSRRAFRPIGRLAAAAAAACLAAGVTACEAGNNAPTLTQYHPQSDGINADVHGIKIRDAFVLGGPIGSSLATGQSAGFFLALFNQNSQDRLVSAAAPGIATAVRLPPGGIRLPSGQAVYLTGPVPRIVLTNLSRPLPGGGSITIVLNFMNAGNVRLVVPVLPRSDYYATFSPAPSPSPSPPATSTGHKKGTGGGPEATSTASPSSPATPSASPS